MHMCTEDLRVHIHNTTPLSVIRAINQSECMEFGLCLLQNSVREVFGLMYVHTQMQVVNTIYILLQEIHMRSGPRVCACISSAAGTHMSINDIPDRDGHIHTHVE